MKDLEENKKIEQLFYFVNFKRKIKEEDQFMLAKKYVDFAYQGEEAIEKHNSFTRSTFLGVEDDEPGKMLKLLENLQKHLKTILDSIIDPQKHSNPIKLKGVKTISFKNKEMVEQFESEKIQNKEITLATEKQISESVFIEMITIDGILLKRFKKCGHCGAYFYHAKKIHCSKECGNIYRQRKYQKGKSKK